MIAKITKPEGTTEYHPFIFNKSLKSLATRHIQLWRDLSMFEEISNYEGVYAKEEEMFPLIKGLGVVTSIEEQEENTHEVTCGYFYTTEESLITALRIDTNTQPEFVGQNILIDILFEDFSELYTGINVPTRADGLPIIIYVYYGTQQFIENDSVHYNKFPNNNPFDYTIKLTPEQLSKIKNNETDEFDYNARSIHYRKNVKIENHSEINSFKYTRGITRTYLGTQYVCIEDNNDNNPATSHNYLPIEITT
jgi:hypothetical protein